MVSLQKQEKGNTKAINISKLMFGIKKTETSSVIIYILLWISMWDH